MTNKKRILISTLLLSLILSAFFVLPVNVQAETGWCYSWFGESGSYTNYTLLVGTVDTGVGILAEDAYTPGDPYGQDIAQIVIDFPSGSYSITTFSATWTETGGSTRLSINLNEASDYSTAVFTQFPGGYVVDIPISVDPGDYLAIQTNNDDPFDAAHLLGFEVKGFGSNPFGSNNCTPPESSTPTPTPTATGTIDPVIGYSSCPLLGDRSKFLNMYDWYATGGATNPVGRTVGLSLPEGSEAHTNVGISALKKYIISVKFHANASVADSFELQFGNTLITFPVATGTSQQSSDLPAANFTGTLFQISRAAGADIDLVIDYACIRAEPDSVPVVNVNQSGGVDTNQTAESQEAYCVDCQFPTYFDLGWYLNYLLCKLGQFILCWLSATVQSIGQQIGVLGTNIIMFIGWLLESILGFPGWVINGIVGLVNWLLGGLVSAQVGTSNAITQTVGDPINTVSGNLRDMPVMLSNAMSTSQSIAVQGGDLITMVWGLFNSFLATIGTVLSQIPFLIDAILTGFNSNRLAGTDAVYSIVCSEASIDLVFYPCVGFYILNHTIFAAETWSSAYYILILIGGAYAYRQVKWTMDKIIRKFIS